MHILTPCWSQPNPDSINKTCLNSSLFSIFGLDASDEPISVYVCTCINMNLHAICVYICINIYICVYVQICIYICICIYIHIDRRIKYMSTYNFTYLINALMCLYIHIGVDIYKHMYLLMNSKKEVCDCIVKFWHGLS
jgi:hypothetical protein